MATRRYCLAHQKSSSVTIDRHIHKTVKVGDGEQLTITGTGDIAPAKPGANGIFVRAPARHVTISNAGTVAAAAGLQSQTGSGGYGGIGIAIEGSAAVTNSGPSPAGTAGIAVPRAITSGAMAGPGSFSPGLEPCPTAGRSAAAPAAMPITQVAQGLPASSWVPAAR